MRDSKLKISIILLLIVIASTAITTYAYFLSSPGEGDFGRIELESATTGSSYMQSGGPIELQVLGEMMVSEKIDPLKPIATKNNETPIKVILRTGEAGGEINCKYDIAYNPTVPFMNSSTNISNSFEYTIKGVENLQGHTIPETSLGNVQEKITLVEDYEISLNGYNKILEQDWSFTVAFYNQNFNQDDNAGITFGGTIIIENMECQNIFVNP